MSRSVNPKIQFDASLGQFLVAIGMIFSILVIPISLYEGLNSTNQVEQGRVAGAYTDQFYSVSSRTSPERISLDTFNVDKALPIWGVGLIGIAGLSIVYLSIGGKVRTKKLWEL